MSDTLWLNETFSSGPIVWDVVPEFWNAEEGWYWAGAEEEPDSHPLNYPRLRYAVSQLVEDDRLSVEVVFDDNTTSIWSVSGGDGVNGFGDNCPQSARHFISGDVTFVSGLMNEWDEEQYQSGYFSAATLHQHWRPHIRLEIRGGLDVYDLHFCGQNENWYDIFTISTATKTIEQLVAMSPVTVRMEWQYATAKGVSDGWAKLWFGSELIYFVENIPVWFDYVQEDEGQPVNTFNVLALGYWSAPGQYWDNLKAGIPGTETWVDIADFVEQELSDSLFPGGVARVVCEAWSSE